ncbi:MAG: ATP-binding cassette domain-containing protein [Thermodesulfobacteriota bacterium]|jgi:ABC-type branched-subunit amino acid transport system ATPase component
MIQSVFAFENIVVGYGTGIVVNGVSGEVGSGEVLSILGRNGVGKSTLLKLFFGFLQSRRGRILFHNKEINDLDPPSRRRLGISYCPQERDVFKDLTVRENLTMMCPERGMDEFSVYFEYFPILRERLSQRAGTLSGGERKILAFTRTLTEKQSLVMLDEPSDSEGVQFLNIERMRILIEELKQGGTSFLAMEQNLAFAETIADHYLVMDHGQPVLIGRRGEINRDELIMHLTV